MRKKAIIGIMLITINVTLITIIVVGIMEIPQVTYRKQDILENIQTVEEDSSWVSFHESENSMNINEKVEMLKQKDDNILAVTLETGKIYSLYEARKNSFNEMCKIPIIKMDIHGPIKDEIEIEPILYINSKSPSQSMIVWSGTVLVNNITYSITLDEESGKILVIHGDGLESNLKETLEIEWSEYLQGNSSNGIVL